MNINIFIKSFLSFVTICMMLKLGLLQSLIR